MEFNNTSKYFKRRRNYNKYDNNNLLNEKTKTDDPAAKDRENRKQVVERIEKALENGSTLEEIVAKLANDEEIKQNFKYLSKLNLEEVFKGWYEGKTRPRRGIEKSEMQIREL